MIVGLSLVVVSLSFLFFRHPPSTWSLFLPPPAPATAAPPPPNRLSQVGQPKHDIPTTREQSAEPEDQTDDETENPSRTAPSPNTTPKAIPSDPPNGTVVPTFSLEAHESSDEEEIDNLPPPSFPALNSAQRASVQPSPMAMAPPPRPPQLAPPRPPQLAPPRPPQLAPPRPPQLAPPPKPAASSFMAPPPQIVPSNLRALPTASNNSQSLRIPASGPLPNRGPVPNRGPPVSNGSLGLPPAVGPTVKTPNARGKVLLTPGHSPLDWANLQRSGKNLSGVDLLVRVTPSMLKHNNGRKGRPAWSGYQGKVYNITPYLPFHPGGEGELRRAAGKDGTKLFMEVHPWVNWENMLGECMVGIMVSEEQATPVETRSSLEDMD